MTSAQSERIGRGCEWAGRVFGFFLLPGVVVWLLGAQLPAGWSSAVLFVLWGMAPAVAAVCGFVQG